MYKIITCDLDETLISRDRTISEENIRAIKAAKEAGVKFVPTTGRGYNSVHTTLKELGLYEEPQQYTISYNGGAITENKDEKILYFQGITFEEAQALYKRGLQYDHICIHIYTPDQVWVRNFYPEEVEYLKKIEGEITDLTTNIDVSYSSNRYMELNRKGVSKGNGLKRLCDLLHVDLKDTIAIGDNYNDLSMIQAAGLGVGVANTIEEMKAECDVITKNDCDHSAIAEVIDCYLLNK